MPRKFGAIRYSPVVFFPNTQYQCFLAVDLRVGVFSLRRSDILCLPRTANSCPYLTIHGSWLGI